MWTTIAIRFSFAARKTRHSWFYVVWVIEINIGIPKVQLEAKVKLRVFSAAGEFFECILFERVEAAKGSASAREIAIPVRRSNRFPLLPERTHPQSCALFGLPKLIGNR